MEIKRVQSHYDSLVQTYSVHFHIISHIFLAFFYTFCVVLVGLTAIELGPQIYLITLSPLLLFYCVIIFSLIQGSRGIRTLDKHTRTYSFFGLSFALVHQILVISLWNSEFMVSFTILYLVLFLEIILIFNLYFNQRIKLIFRYISNLSKQK